MSNLNFWIRKDSTLRVDGSFGDICSMCGDVTGQSQHVYNMEMIGFVSDKLTIEDKFWIVNRLNTPDWGETGLPEKLSNPRFITKKNCDPQFPVFVYDNKNRRILFTIKEDEERQILTEEILQLLNKQEP